jgi:VanZ family protein
MAFNQVRLFALCIAIVASNTGALLRADQVTVHRRQELEHALATAAPGTEILLWPGTYEAAGSIAGLQGAAGAPIIIRGALAHSPPVLRGGLKLSSVAHCRFENLIIESASDDGVTIDHGAVDNSSSHHVTIRSVTVRTGGGPGKRDGIRLTAVDDFAIIDCRLESWGNGGQALDIVGCHTGLIAGCRLDGAEVCPTGLQVRGGSREIEIEGCDFTGITERCVQLGGATEQHYFRPVSTNFEARDITVRDCRFCGGETAVAFVNADHCEVAGNTMYRQRRYLVRILQENLAEQFLPCGNGRLVDNIIVWRRGDFAVVADAGPQTDPASFRFSGNFWYCEDAPHDSMLAGFPSPEVNGVHGEDPRLYDPDRCDLRPLRTRESMRQAAKSRPAWLPWLPAIGKAAGWTVAALLAVVTAAWLWNWSSGLHNNTSLDKPRSAHRWFFGLAVAGALLFVYGSLLPLTYQPQTLDVALARFRNTPYLHLDVYHLADWMANLLLFVPIAYCATACVVVRRTHLAVKVTWMAAIWLCCAGLSVAVEFLQVWFPPRTVSQNDILAECLGAAVGGVASVITARPLASWVQKAANSVRPAQIFDFALQVYFLGYIAFAVMPLDVVIDADSLRLKWELGRIALVTGGELRLTAEHLLDYAGRLVLCLPLGMFLGRRCPRIILAGAKCVSVALLIESAQVFVFSRFASLADAALLTMGMVAGVVLVRNAGTRFDAWWNPAATKWRRPFVAAGVVAYAVLVAELVVPPRKIDVHLLAWERMPQFWAPPFAALYWGSEFHALTMTAEAILLFMPLGFAAGDLACATTSTRARWRLGLAFSGLGSFAAILELAQAWLPEATIDITNTLCYLIGATAGCGLRLTLQGAVKPAAQQEQLPRPSMKSLLAGCVTTGLLAAILTAWALPAIGIQTATRQNTTHELNDTHPR